MASRSLPEKYVSIDVECVATGRRHNARSVALVAIVDQDERVLLMKKVKPSETIVSFDAVDGSSRRRLGGRRAVEQCIGGGQASARS